MLTQEQREKYFEENKGLVHYVMYKMLNINKQDVYYEDVVQQGYLRLLHCIDYFDWENAPCAFSTFAVTALLRHLRLYINKERTGVYTVCGLDISDYLLIKKCDEEHKATGLTKNRENYIRKMFGQKVGFDEIYPDTAKPKYCLKDDEDNIEHIDMQESLDKLVKECMQEASGNTRKVIEVYWRNMQQGKSATALTVSEEVGISKQRVNAILQKFRKQMQIKCLKNGICL